MALHPVAVSPVASSSGAFRLARSLVPIGRTLWGLAVGVLFLLASIVLAPLLWACDRLRAASNED